MLPLFLADEDWADWEDYVMGRALAIQRKAEEERKSPKKKERKTGGGGGGGGGGKAASTDAEQIATEKAVKQQRHNTHAAAVLQAFTASKVLLIGKAENTSKVFKVVFKVFNLFCDFGVAPRPEACLSVYRCLRSDLGVLLPFR